ncbi:hypothetical protein [Ensifer sp. Root127]|uniref:hypothetical protein n=1 Tax=Ensifer sp. Root127 TaxID=1736440 RepID=UPI0012E3984C|nr:hypothetical protein [Ensifer sp. Root127]
MEDRRDSVSAGLFASGAHPTRSAEPIGVHLLTLSPFRIERSSTTSMVFALAIDWQLIDNKIWRFKLRKVASLATIRISTLTT